MSYLVDDRVTLVRSVDPVARINGKEMFAISQGAAQSSWQPTASSNWSNQNIQFTLNPTSGLKTIVDRHMQLSGVFYCTFAGTTTNGYPLLNQTSGQIALRSLPWSQIIQTISLQIGNQSWNYSMNQSIIALMQFGVHEKDAYLSTSPLYPLDQSQNYSELYLSNRNPLGSYASSVGYGTELRGAWNDLWTSFTTNTVSASFFAPVCEDIYLSPLLFSNFSQSKGFIAVPQINLNLALNNLQRILSISAVPGINITSVNVSIASAPNLLTRQLVPQVNVSIPDSLSYGFSSVQNFPTIYTNPVAPGGTFQVTTQATQLGQVPEKIYFYARIQDNLQTAFTTDTYAQITNINIQFGSQTGILSTATPEQLYMISRKNGLRAVDYVQWANHVGSVLCVSPVDDFGLDPSIAPSLLNFSANIQAIITFKNINTTQTVNFVVYCVTVVGGVINVQTTGGSYLSQTGFLTREDVLKAPELKEVNAHEMRNAIGGNFLSSIKDWVKDNALPALKGAHDFVKSNKLISQGATFLGNKFNKPFLTDVGQIAEKAGYGPGRSGRGTTGGKAMYL
jgi:hypothetical protein